MALKETEELLEIWRANNRFEWSDAAFDIVKEILTERGIELPAQHEPMYERPEDEIDEEHHPEDVTGGSCGAIHARVWRATLRGLGGCGIAH